MNREGGKGVSSLSLSEFRKERMDSVRRKEISRERTDGQTISPTGPSPFIKGIFPSSSSASMIAGREKASVFPDPVKAIPIMSRPEKL